MIHESAALRDRAPVFRDREAAGRALADLLGPRLGSDTRILAIPAGGVPVALALARRQRLRVGVAVVSKLTPPWNTEVGYGAVAFDGSVSLNQPLIDRLGLDEEAVAEGIAATRSRVARRVRALPPLGDLAGADVLLVDDGIASGFTLATAVAAVRRAGAARVRAAVPTGSLRALSELASRVDDVFCANVRTAASFAVADADARWYDVPEAEALALLVSPGTPA